MSLLNTILATTLLLLSSFGLFKTVEATSCRHEMVVQGFWMASQKLTSHSWQIPIGVACGSPLVVQITDEGISAIQLHGEYHFKLSTDVNSNELK